MKEALYNIYFDENTHIHISNGNKKVGKGVYNISLLPGDKPLTKKDGTVLTNISGTCGGCCKNCKQNCYAIRHTTYHHNSCIPAYADNTLLARFDIDTYFKEIQQFINRNIVAVIRFHVAGEIPSYEYLIKMYELAKNNSDVKFYVYTKRYKWVEELIKNYGSLPNNFVILVSIWHNNYKNPLQLPEFIYDDGTEDAMKKVFHCPAVDKNGRETGMTCAACKKCIMAKNGDKIAVYSH